MTLTAGDQAPAFATVDQAGNAVSLTDFSGQYVVLYFYPKDDTPGCTKEACSFRDHRATLADLDAVVLGVSKDSAGKHQKFIDKYDLNFPLLVDEEGTICQAYGAWGEKSMYGKTYFGINRMTFVIGPDQKIAYIFKKVKTATHGEDVAKILTDLRAAA